MARPAYGFDNTRETVAMRRLLVLGLLVVGCLAPGTGRAQSPGRCDACVDAANCGPARETCVAECRARLFSIDPRRAECTTGCGNTAIQCARSAEAACRAGNLCR